MKIFEFKQRRVNGYFIFNEIRGISRFVLIEADSADEANAKARALRMRFHGERWQPATIPVELPYTAEPRSRTYGGMYPERGDPTFIHIRRRGFTSLHGEFRGVPDE